MAMSDYPLPYIRVSLEIFSAKSGVSSSPRNLHRQLPLSIAGTFIRACSSRPSKSCNGTTQVLATDITRRSHRKLMNWRHSGFSVHAGNRIARDDRDGRKALAEYSLRNAFSEKKITALEDTGKVLDRSTMTHGSNKTTFEIFTAKEFIAAITQHIPDKHFQMVRTYGWCSSRSRGERKKPVLNLSKGPGS
jgi:hypothetical protein